MEYAKNAFCVLLTGTPETRQELDAMKLDLSALDPPTVQQRHAQELGFLFDAQPAFPLPNVSDVSFSVASCSVVVCLVTSP